MKNNNERERAIKTPAEKHGEFDVPMENIRLERGYARYNSDSLRVAMEDFYFCIERNYQHGLSYYMVGCGSPLRYARNDTFIY